MPAFAGMTEVNAAPVTPSQHAAAFAFMHACFA
jgi:hypothetical protein